MAEESELVPFFKRSEFACRCGCGYDTVDFALLEALSHLRGYFRRPVIINDACRCDEQNKRTPGAASNSQHLLGKAADIAVVGISPQEVQAILRKWYPDKYGIGRAVTYTHFDVRSQKADWSY